MQSILTKNILLLLGASNILVTCWDSTRKSGRAIPNSPNGADALQYLPVDGRDMERLSCKLNKTSKDIRNLFISDPSLHLDLNFIDDESKAPAIFYIEQRRNITGKNYESSNQRRATGVDVFKLHSRPGSSRVIYLDFDGHSLSGTAWNDAAHPTIIAPPCDWDGTPNTFSEKEQGYIQEIWSRVSEDYAPFDIDVTTEYIGGNENFLIRSSPSDLAYGLRVLISPGIMSLWCSCGGISYVGVFGAIGGGYYEPSLVFPDALGYLPRYIAEAASHEAGHTFGLHHDGTSTAAYYTGQGSGEVGWAPIMGEGYDRELVQWSRGEYSDANNQEDDLAIIASAAPYRPDDHPDTVAAAKTASLISSGTVLAGSGVIQRTGDLDVFPLVAGAGLLTVTASPTPTGPNLDILLELLGDDGGVIASANPTDRLAAMLACTLSAAGTYFLRVSGVGAGYPIFSGYSNYASLGQYTLAGTIPPPPSTTTTTSVRSLLAPAASTSRHPATAAPSTGWPLASYTATASSSSLVAATSPQSVSQTMRSSPRIDPTFVATSSLTLSKHSVSTNQVQRLTSVSTFPPELFTSMSVRLQLASSQIRSSSAPQTTFPAAAINVGVVGVIQGDQQGDFNSSFVPYVAAPGAVSVAIASAAGAGGGILLLIGVTVVWWRLRGSVASRALNLTVPRSKSNSCAQGQLVTLAPHGPQSSANQLLSGHATETVVAMRFVDEPQTLVTERLDMGPLDSAV